MQRLIKVFYTRMIAAFFLLSISYFHVQSQTDFKTKTEVLAYLVSRKTFINEQENTMMNFSEMGNKVAIGTEKYSNPKITFVSSSVAILEYQLLTNAQVQISLIVDARENSIMNRKSEKIFKASLTIPDQTSSMQQQVQSPQQPATQTQSTEIDTRKDANGWGLCISNVPIMPVYLLINTNNNKPIDFDFIEAVAIKKKDALKLKDQIKIVRENVKSVDINCNYKGNNFENDGACDMVILKDGTYLTNAIAKRGSYHCSLRGKFELDEVEFGPLSQSKTKPLNLTPSLKNLLNEQNNILYAKLD